MTLRKISAVALIIVVAVACAVFFYRDNDDKPDGNKQHDNTKPLHTCTAGKLDENRKNALITQALTDFILAHYQYVYPEEARIDCETERDCTLKKIPVLSLDDYIAHYKADTILPLLNSEETSIVNAKSFFQGQLDKKQHFPFSFYFTNSLNVDIFFPYNCCELLSKEAFFKLPFNKNLDNLNHPERWRYVVKIMGLYITNVYGGVTPRTMWSHYYAIDECGHILTKSERMFRESVLPISSNHLDFLSAFEKNYAKMKDLSCASISFEHAVQNKDDSKEKMYSKDGKLYLCQ